MLAERRHASSDMAQIGGRRSGVVAVLLTTDGLSPFLGVLHSVAAERADIPQSVHFLLGVISMYPNPICDRLP